MQVRMGINSGPVIAGVIGKKKFIFDLWNDTVNVASRMESHGVDGEIQVSEYTYQLLNADFRLEHRGNMKIKGKGIMATYLLKSEKSGAESSTYNSKKDKKDSKSPVPSTKVS